MSIPAAGPRFTIGVLSNLHLLQGSQYWNGYLRNVLRGIETAARERGCNLLLACSNSQEALFSTLHTAWPQQTHETDFVPIGPWNSDGLVIIHSLRSEQKREYVRGLQAQGLPLVFVGASDEAAAVGMNNEAGVRQALLHLAAHGHRDVAFLAGSENCPAEATLRLAAFRKLRGEMGLNADERLIGYGGMPIVSGYRAMRQVLAAEVTFTAVLGWNDESAVGAVQALREARLRVPTDVAVIGFDDCPEAVMDHPKLTTVHYPMFESGYRAVELLLDVVAQPTPSARVTVQLPARVVVRQSCGCSPEDRIRPGIEGAGGDVPELTASLLASLSLEAQNLGPDAAAHLCRRLAEAFNESLARVDALPFHAALTDALERIEATGEDPHVWLSVLSTLQDRLPLVCGNGEVEKQAVGERMLREARESIGESVHRVRRRYLIEQVERDARVNAVVSRLQSALSEEGVIAALEEVLPTLETGRMGIWLYRGDGEDPVANSEVLLRAGNWASDASLRFPSRSFPPEGLLESEQPFSLGITPLAVRDETLGFLAFDLNGLEAMMSIAAQLAAALRNARLYREAAEGRRLAEEATRIKSDFLSLVSHELRAPLNVIVGLSDTLLREDSDALGRSESTRRAISRINHSAEHLSWLIRDVLDLAGNEAGQLQLCREPLDLAETLRPVAEMGAQMAQEKELRWAARLPANLPPVWGDRTRLRQVAINLVSNAVKFTSQGEVLLKAEHDGDSVLVTVRDTGLGIAPEDQAIVFDEFRQAERTANRGYGGLGLGLAIARRLVEMHGGEIGVHSSGAMHAGSTFFFRLPAMDPEAATPQAPILTNRIPRSVLIVDDDTGMLEYHTRLVERLAAGHQVATANNGRAALDIIHRDPPDIVLLDLIMPGLSGFGVLEAMRANPLTRDIPVIVMTAQQPSEADMARLTPAVTAVLDKGVFTPEETLAHIEAALARSRRIGAEAQRLVRRAMAYMRAHHDSPVTREQIARHVAISEAYLTRCFQQELGMPPMTYLTRYRVSRAKALLEEGDRSVTEVAQTVGFADETYFMRVFRREVGITPGAYRRGQRPGN